MRDVPRGTFSYRDPREYTPTQALDVLNGYLISRGYALVRRDKFLLVLKIANSPKNVDTESIDGERKPHDLQPTNVLGLSLRPAAVDELGSQSRYRGGLTAIDVRPASPAAAAGIRAGDVLVGLGPWETTKMEDVEFAVQRTIMDRRDSLKFYLLRDGETVYGTLKLSDTPAGAEKPSAERKDRKDQLTVEHEGWIYIVDREQKTLSAFDAATAKLVWQTKLGSLTGNLELDVAGNKVEFRRLSHPTGSIMQLADGRLLGRHSRTFDSVEERQSRTNLGNLADAMHQYQKRVAHPYYPPAVVLGPDGKTPHSWRVELLPFLGHTDLYKEYRLDEPWDSEQNRKLLDRMPDVFRHPSDPLTPYQVITGNWKLDRSPVADRSGAVGLPVPQVNTLFSSVPHREGLRMQDIISGIANTLLIVEHKQRVPWTKPEDIAVGPELGNLKLGGIWPSGFYAALADTSAKFLPDDLAPETLQRLLSPMDGEGIDWDSLHVTPPGENNALPKPEESGESAAVDAGSAHSRSLIADAARSEDEDQAVAPRNELELMRRFDSAIRNGDLHALVDLSATPFLLQAKGVRTTITDRDELRRRLEEFITSPRPEGLRFEVTAADEVGADDELPQEWSHVLKAGDSILEVRAEAPGGTRDDVKSLGEFRLLVKERGDHRRVLVGYSDAEPVKPKPTPAVQPRRR